MLRYREKYEFVTKINQLTLKKKLLKNKYLNTLTNIHNFNFLYYQQK